MHFYLSVTQFKDVAKLTRVCKICVLHPFLLDWVEKLVSSGYNLREVTRRLNAHGLNISYQTVQKHKKHKDSAHDKRISQEMGFGKQEHISILQNFKNIKRQRKELESWIKAESNPPLEATNAYIKLCAQIMQWEMTLRSTENL